MTAVEENSMIRDAKVYQEWAWSNPVTWCHCALGVSLWEKQAECIKSVRDNKRVSVRSCHSVGKSVVAGCVALWYLNSVAPSRVITTSSTWSNLKGILWSYIPQLIRDAKFDVTMGGNLLSMGLEIANGWDIVAISPEKPDSMGGYHSKNGVLVIVDESSALEKAHMEAIEAIITTEKSRLFLIGNPLRPEGPFYETFSSPEWHNIHISATDSPNVKAGNEVFPGLATLEWMDSRKREWGEQSPQYLSRVLGEFPESGDDVLIPLTWVEKAQERTVPRIDKDSLVLGVDVARFGDDRTILLARDDNAVRCKKEYTRQDTMTTAGAVMAFAKEMGIEPENIFVDDTGLGGGVTDRLREQDFPVRPVNFGAKADDSKQFANVRAECHWRLRDALDPQKDKKLAIPVEYSTLAKECSMPHYGFTSSGQIQLESKDKIKKRLGRSPDEADALALTYARRISNIDVIVV